MLQRVFHFAHLLIRLNSVMGVAWNRPMQQSSIYGTEMTLLQFTKASNAT